MNGTHSKIEMKTEIILTISRSHGQAKATALPVHGAELDRTSALECSRCIPKKCMADAKNCGSDQNTQHWPPFAGMTGFKFLHGGREHAVTDEAKYLIN
jgi:hypothetical protein